MSADANLKGRLKYRDGGPPFEVLLDGSRLSWEEFGRTLEPFEGWDFEFRFCDTERVDTGSLRLDSASNEVSFRGSGADTTARIPKEGLDPRASQTNDELENRANDTSPTINDALNDFLAEQKMRLSTRTYRGYAHVVRLLKRCLNDYGHLTLHREEHARWEEASESDNDEAFCQLFTADKIADVLPEFLGHFMRRKVAATEWQLQASGVVIKKLAKWLASADLLDEKTAAEEIRRAADAGRRLPPAHRLARLLRDQAEQSRLNMASLADYERVDGCLEIEDVRAGALWFEGGIGPVRVPREVSELASRGYSVNIVLGRQERLWHILEVGFVHPSRDSLPSRPPLPARSGSA